MLSAQARGHSLYHYVPRDLSYRAGSVSTPARPVTVQRVGGGHFSLRAPTTRDGREHVVVILMRQEPALDVTYYPATHLFERVRVSKKMVNQPAPISTAPAHP